MSDSYSKVAEGAHCEVWLHKDAEKTLKSAPAKDRARIERILDHLSENGPSDLNEQQFKFEYRTRVNHGEIAIYAVKSYQTRLLGGWRDGSARILRRFVCPEATIKKQNEANQDQLKRAAKKVGAYSDHR